MYNIPVSRKQDGVSIFPAIIRVPSAHTLGAVVAGLFLSGCAAFKESPVAVAQFMDTNYTEHRADPGRVLDERMKMKKYAPTKAGYVLCGFVDFDAKIVWTSRHIDCPADETRRHEFCHVDAHERGIKDECHDGRSFR